MTTAHVGEDAIREAVKSLIAEHPCKVSQARVKPALLGWFVGQTMKAVSGNAASEAVNAVVVDEFANL